MATPFLVHYVRALPLPLVVPLPVSLSPSLLCHSSPLLSSNLIVFELALSAPLLTQYYNVLFPCIEMFVITYQQVHRRYEMVSCVSTLDNSRMGCEVESSLRKQKIFFIYKNK